MNTTLPRLGSRVRISFLAQEKPPISGGFFRYAARVSEGRNGGAPRGPCLEKESPFF